MAGGNSKILGQVQGLMDTGLNKPAVGFGAKATAPKSTSPVHNRGLTIGGKQRVASSEHSVTPKQVPAIKVNEGGGSPKGPHPAVAKNPAGNPGVKWG